MTIYNLDFVEDAKKEWDKPGGNVREQFKKKLAERLIMPHVTAARLRGLPDCYKIKLRAAGYRLVYRVDNETVTVVVVAVGRRDRNAAYKAAVGRLD